MDIQVKEKQGASMKGVYRFTVASLKTPEQFALHQDIVAFEKRSKGEFGSWLNQQVQDEYIQMVRKLNSICETKIYEHENIIPTVGRGMLANNLVSNSPTDSPRINYTALGTGSVTPANGDTALGSESYRKSTASATNADNVAYVTAFYTATEVSGTFTEHALYCNGTASANSGVLFSRVLLNSGSGISKSNTETLTIDYTITIS